MSAGSVRQASLDALMQVANNTKLIVKENSHTFKRKFPNFTFSTFSYMNSLPVYLKVLYRISVNPETQDAFRHSATACCCRSDVIKALPSAVLQYARSRSADQSARKCTRHGWMHKTPQYVGCDWVTVHPAGALCVEGCWTEFGQTHR